MLDFQRFVNRLGVGNDNFRGDGQQNDAPPPVVFDTYRNTFLFTQSNADPSAQPGQAAPPPSRGIGRCWVSLIQHLFVTAIQGNHELHADNMFTFGSNLTEFILSRCAPIQSTPAQCVVYESFQHVDNEVVPLRVASGARPTYFVRSINDIGAIQNGLGTELPPVLGAHPIEDVMHLGSWIQLYSILHSGGKPAVFEPFPEYNGRPPELVRGRTYPLLGVPGSTKRGTICLCADSRRMARITETDDDSIDWAVRLVPLATWFDTLTKSKLMVAPLIFRHHAVFRDGARNALWVSSCDSTEAPPAYNASAFEIIDEDDLTLPSQQFLDCSGQYAFRRAPGEILRVPFDVAHERLLPIGTFILVKSAALGPFGFAGNRLWVRASTRYPDEGIVGVEIHLHKVYFAIRVKERNVVVIRIACADPMDCCILDEHAEITASSIALEAVVQPLAGHGANAQP